MIKERSKEITPKVDKKSFLISTIFPLAILIFANFFFCIILNIFNPNRGLETVKQKWQLAQNVETPPEWLVIGDSSGNQGFNNKVFDSLMNTNSLNLCTIGDMILFDDLWFLEYFQSIDKLPKNILMIHNFDVFQREMIYESGYQQIPKFSFETSLKVPFEYNGLAKFLPIIYRINSIKYFLGDMKKAINKNYSFQNKGQLIIHENNQESVLKSLDAYREDINEKGTYKMYDNNIKALTLVAKLANENNINFYFADPGLYEGLMESEEFKNYYSQYKSTIIPLSKKLNIQYLDNGFDGYTMDEMEATVDHIIYPASINYTKKIVEALSQNN